MNVDELRSKVKESKINPNFYSILETKLIEGLVFKKAVDSWEVYQLDEHGGIHNKNIFENENEACLYFLSELKKGKDQFGSNYLIHE